MWSDIKQCWKRDKTVYWDWGPSHSLELLLSLIKYEKTNA